MYNKIKQDQLDARKKALAKDDEAQIHKIKANLLTTLLGAIQNKMDGKPASDDVVIAVIRSFVKANDESYRALILTQEPIDTEDFSTAAMMKELNECYDITKLLIEAKILTSYLPAVFNEADVRGVIDLMLPVNLQIGKVMGACKTTAALHNKLFDGAIVQRVFKEYQNA